jgi:hypothetical protein
VQVLLSLKGLTEGRVTTFGDRGHVYARDYDGRWRDG